MSAPGPEGRSVVAALAVFPAAFRAEYGDEMRLLARDTVRDARADGARAVHAARARIVLGAGLALTPRESASRPQPSPVATA